MTGDSPGPVPPALVTAPATPANSGQELDDPARIAQAKRLSGHIREEAIERLAILAAQLTGAPNAEVSILSDRHVLVGIHGREVPEADREGPLERSLCMLAVADGAALSVPDAPADERVGHLSPVTSGRVGAYVGVPVVAGGTPVGALCVYDASPRPWSAQDLRILQALAETVATELELSTLAAEAVQSAVRLDLSFAAANMGSFDWNLLTGELEWDDRLRDLFGYGDDYVPHIDSFNARLHPDDLERTSAAIAEALSACGEYGTEYRVVLPDGTTRWIAARGRALCGADGQAERLIGAAYDTTATHASSERLARLLETMSSAFYSLDPEWRFTYVNGPAETLLRRGREELVGHSIWDEFPEAEAGLIGERYRHAVATDEPVTLELFYPPLQAWFEIQGWPSPDGLSVFFHDISDRVSAQEEHTRAHERLELLSTAGSRLSATLEVAEILDLLSELVVPRFGEWLAVALHEDLAAMLAEREAAPRGELSVVGVTARDPAEEARVGEALTGLTVARTGRGTWEAAADAAVRSALAGGRDAVGDSDAGSDGDGGGDSVASPGPEVDVLTRALVSRGRTVGVLVVGEPPSEPADRELLGDVATRAGVALDNAYLYGAERRAGVALQRSLLPSKLPQFANVEMAARYLPGTAGRDVGGDFYIGHELDDGRLLIAIGDVMGHGMQAAAQMGQLRAVLTAYAFDGEAPDRVLARVADRADRLIDVGMATVALLIYDPAARRLTAASAGHPPPLLAPLHEPPAFLELRPGPPIGAGVARYESVTVEVPAETTVVLYTDGLVESRGHSIDAGLGRLREGLIDLRMPPEAVCDHVLRKLGRTRATSDDVALLVFSHA